MAKPSDAYARDGDSVISAMMWLEMATLDNSTLSKLNMTVQDAIQVAHVILQVDLNDQETSVKYHDALKVHNKIQHDFMLNS